MVFAVLHPMHVPHEPRVLGLLPTLLRSLLTIQNADQEKVHNILAYSGGPPIDNPGEGYYYKVVPGNGKYIVNYFKNGHKENQSGWRFCGTNDCPYQQ